jgi:hypothetical protein
MLSARRYNAIFSRDKAEGLAAFIEKSLTYF